MKIFFQLPTNKHNFKHRITFSTTYSLAIHESALCKRVELIRNHHSRTSASSCLVSAIYKFAEQSTHCATHSLPYSKQFLTCHVST